MWLASRRNWPLVAVLAALLLVVASCGDGEQPDTAAVALASGQSGGQGWRLEGRRAAGQPCAFLVLAGVDRPPVGRCGVRRTELRHLDPVSVTVGERRLVFSPLEGRARRVRIDTTDGAIRIEPARTAAGYPARFFLVELDPALALTAVRVFGDGGRAVVT